MDKQNHSPHTCPSLSRDPLEQIREILDLPGRDGFSIVQWISPEQAVPEDASYILLKERGSEGVLTIEAAYENGAFWDTVPYLRDPIPPQRILGRSYPPYDLRLDSLGRASVFLP